MTLLAIFSASQNLSKNSMSAVRFLATNNNLLPFPSKIFAVSKLPEKLFVVGSSGIEIITKHLSPDLRSERATVLDAYPGDGILARSLLEAGLPTVHILEKSPEYAEQKNFEELKNSFPDRVHVHDANLGFHDDDNMSEIITRIAPSDTWPKNPPLKAIITTPPFREGRLLSYLFGQFVNQMGIFSCGRPEIYINVSYYLAASMAADYRSKSFATYRARSVLTQSLFDYEFLDKIPWEEFYPQVHVKKFKRKKDSSNYYFDDPYNSFLMKLTPKENLPSLVSIESLPEYRFLVNQSMHKRTNYLIPYFEKWFPGCGTRLIKAGIPLFSKFGDASPDSFLDLFNLITSWPEYATSTFKAGSDEQKLLLFDEAEDDLLIDASNGSELSESAQP